MKKVLFSTILTVGLVFTSCKKDEEAPVIMVDAPMDHAEFAPGDEVHAEFEFTDKTISIPHTLLISAISIISNTSRVVSMDLKQAGDLIYIVGVTQNELGGSEYFRTLGFIGNSVPKVNPHQAKKLMERLSLATKNGLVRSCHDLSEGGIGVAIAEMAFAGGLGAVVSLKDVPLGEPMGRDDLVLFSESNSRFLV